MVITGYWIGFPGLYTRTLSFIRSLHNSLHLLIPKSQPIPSLPPSSWRPPVCSLCLWVFIFHQFSSVARSCPTLWDPMECSMPGLPVHHQLPEFTQTHVHWVTDVIQPSHPLSSPSPPTFNLSQHQGLFKWVSSSQQVAKVLEFQLQHQSFQRTPRTDLL